MENKAEMKNAGRHLRSATKTCLSGMKSLQGQKLSRGYRCTTQEALIIAGRHKRDERLKEKALSPEQKKRKAELMNGDQLPSTIPLTDKDAHPYRKKTSKCMKRWFAARRKSSGAKAEERRRDETEGTDGGSDE